jgi:hypothetical protein
MRFHWTIALLCALIAVPAHAIRTSYRNAHPVGWMHLLPTGEQPGWSGNAWTSLELNHANVWNMSFTMRDRRTDKLYTYEADFEQSSAIFELGAPLDENFALTVEIPYANRNGGFLDDFIDQFHQAINGDRFFRHLNDQYSNTFSVKTDGEDRLASEHGQGVGNVKAKLKWWLWKWKSWTPGVCECGFAVSEQIKLPTQSRKFGLSSGTNDYSTLFHLGAPMGDYSAIWATAAFTKLGANETFAEWPRRDWAEMYELAIDWGWGEHFGVLLQARAESPIMNRDHLEFEYSYVDQRGQTAERVASGWNSLTAWRGSQALGLRWRWGEGSQFNFLFVEDWGLGDEDDRGDFLYVNNAPDVAFISQWLFIF